MVIKELEGTPEPSALSGSEVRYLGLPFVVRPPGFPLLLTPVLAVFGTDFSVLNAAVSLLGLIGIGLLYAFYRPWLGALPAAALNDLIQQVRALDMEEVRAEIAREQTETSPSPA